MRLCNDFMLQIISMMRQCLIFPALMAGAIFATGCHSGIQQQPAWKNYLADNQLEGCLMLYDNMHDQVKVYPLQAATQRHAPAQSFVLFSSLVGLESGVIADTSSLLRTPQNDTLTMAEWFRSDPAGLNEWLASHIQPQVMRLWIDSVHYGAWMPADTATLQALKQAFWQNGHLRISPDEQLGFLIHLYFHELPFHERPQRLLQQLMTRETTPRYTLSYISSAFPTDTSSQSWILGWEEENKHPYFFSVYLESKLLSAEQLQAKAITLAKQWLRDQGFFEGKK
ncbi:MAG: hypothetical protein IRZ29_05050 [Thermoflavifilum sp.]|nr:hypothetical protein [Thermoflavifilum sp.]